MRPRKSDALHDLHGTKPHPSTMRDTVATAAKPKLPAYLSPDARKEWRKLLPLLMERRSLTAADAAALAMHCEVFARWVQCQRQITEQGITLTVTVLSSNGEPITRTRPHPALRIAQDCERSLRASLRELGLTPASRQRVMAARPAEETGETSIMELLGQNDG
jgi:P27 family predicted phage terminase small subunit